MSKHTPGPWAVQKAEDCLGRKLDDLVEWVVTGNEHDLWISTGPTWDQDHSEESEANARLIAAAPELLEALVHMVKWHGKRELPTSDSKVESLLPIDQQNDEVRLAMQAIAKATGEP